MTTDNQLLAVHFVWPRIENPPIRQGWMLPTGECYLPESSSGDAAFSANFTEQVAAGRCLFFPVAVDTKALEAAQ